MAFLQILKIIKKKKTLEKTIKDKGQACNILIIRIERKENIKTICSRIPSLNNNKNNNTSKCPWACKEMHKKFSNVYLRMVGLQAAFIFF